MNISESVKRKFLKCTLRKDVTRGPKHRTQRTSVWQRKAFCFANEESFHCICANSVRFRHSVCGQNVKGEVWQRIVETAKGYSLRYSLKLCIDTKNWSQRNFTQTFFLASKIFKRVHFVVNVNAVFVTKKICEKVKF